MCNLRISRLFADLPIAVMATGTRSNVTPVVLREDTRPPAYGDKYFEGASRTFYSRYMEYKKRVAHANAGGAIRREVVAIAELFPTSWAGQEGGECVQPRLHSPIYDRFPQKIDNLFHRHIRP